MEHDTNTLRHLASVMGKTDIAGLMPKRWPLGCGLLNAPVGSRYGESPARIGPSWARRSNNRGLGI